MLRVASRLVPHVSRKALKRTGIVLAIGLVAASAGTTLVAYAVDRAHADRILPGVTVAGVDVGGMTRQQAISAVRAHRRSTNVGSAAPACRIPGTVSGSRS